MATLQPNRLTSISTELAEFDHASDKMRSTRDALHNGPATGSATRESGPFEVSLSAPVKVTPPRAHLEHQKGSKKAPRGPQGGTKRAPRGAQERPKEEPKRALRGVTFNARESDTSQGPLRASEKLQEGPERAPGSRPGSTPRGGVGSDNFNTLLEAS